MAAINNEKLIFPSENQYLTNPSQTTETPSSQQDFSAETQTTTIAQSVLKSPRATGSDHERLDLSHCAQIQDISFFEGPIQLNLGNCRQIRDLSFLAPLFPASRDPGEPID